MSNTTQKKIYIQLAEGGRQVTIDGDFGLYCVFLKTYSNRATSDLDDVETRLDELEALLSDVLHFLEAAAQRLGTPGDGRHVLMERIRAALEGGGQ